MSLIPEFANVPAAATIQPETFKVAIPDSSLSELKQLLKVARVAPPTHENSLADHSYGLSSNWIERSKSYWETTFDWLAAVHAGIDIMLTCKIQAKT